MSKSEENEMSARRRAGFTLIELLVVIAIIAILAAILFPVFAQAREKARLITCTSNMKNLGTALSMYTQDYDEELPSWPFQNGNPATNTPGLFTDPRFQNTPNGNWSYAVWVDAIQPYVKNWAIFACPNGPLTQLRGPASNRVRVNLAYNEYIMNWNNGWHNLAKLSGGGANGAGVADISVIAESSFSGIYQDWSDGNNFVPGKHPGFGLYRLYCANGVANGGRTCTARHTDNGINVVYADGHAKFVPGGKIQGPQGGREFPVVNPNNRPWF
jgi:prepilin-type N-terminal cleavage/methylation domain-containing protein/prepilin-type processing-associated H-X9-DG protein